MFRKITMVIFVILTYSCAQNSKSELNDKDSLNLKMVSQENVSVLGGPPMIPVDHPVVIGDDIDKYSNGGENCLECHNNSDADDVPQTLHPERNNCVQCHIPQNEETATEQDFNVENVFKKKTSF